MKSSLRILHLEDDATDAQLVQDTLDAGGIACHVRRVETEAEFGTALRPGGIDPGIDLILADYTLPSFDGLSAFQIAQRDRPELPFIFVSGTIDEELAIEALKTGATDYVFKTRLSRIVPSVQRALRDAEARAEMRRAEEALRSSEAYLAEAQRLSHTGSFGWAVSSGQLYWSLETFRIFDYDPDAQMTVDRVVERFHPEDRSFLMESMERVSRERAAFDWEHRLLMPDGTVKHLHVVGRPNEGESGVFEFVGAITDITERKRSESALQNAVDEIKRLRDQLYKENIALREEIDKASMFEEIVGHSPTLRTVLARVAKVAHTDSTVLITGETGTGKELIARAVHKRSQRSGRPFVSVNCAALAPTLVASELFGHEKGAFTGATQRRLGRFEMADGGTIFLDEVGELPPDTQAALLRVIQEREFERVGSGQPVRVDVRVIAATNRDLNAAAANGAFRQDLLYRLNVFPIEMPALRERKEDILMLVEYFVQRYANRVGKNIRSIDQKTLDLLQSYDWPGNIRELQNVIERSIILNATDVFSVDELWLSKRTPSRTPRVEAPLALNVEPRSEREIIEAALAESRGRISGASGAAAQLRVPPSTLESRIKMLRIDKRRFKFRQ
jgi:formate hydrogenlyase transcriptional activator